MVERSSTPGHINHPPDKVVASTIATTTTTTDAANINTAEESQGREDSDGSSYDIPVVPVGFKDYKVIQDKDKIPAQVILLKRSTFEQIFMQNPRNDGSDGYNLQAEDDDIVLKMYSFCHLEKVYFYKRYAYIEGRCADSRFYNADDFIDHILEDKYQNEVEINKIISKHNKSVEAADSTSTKRKINSPQMIAYGPMVTGEYLSSFSGFFIAFEYIKSGGDLKAKHLSQLQAQLEEIHSCNIAHCSLSLRNIIVDINDDARIIDFNNSYTDEVSEDGRYPILLNHLMDGDYDQIVHIQERLVSDDNDDNNDDK